MASGTFQHTSRVQPHCLDALLLRSNNQVKSHLASQWIRGVGAIRPSPINLPGIRHYQRTGARCQQKNALIGDIDTARNKYVPRRCDAGRWGVGWWL